MNKEGNSPSISNKKNNELNTYTIYNKSNVLESSTKSLNNCENSFNSSIVSETFSVDEKSNSDNHNYDSSNNIKSKLVSYNYMNEKAGMKGINKEKINQIIEESTKNSAIYLKNKTKRDNIKVQVYEDSIKLNTFYSNKSLVHSYKLLKDKTIENLKKQRIYNKIWLHIDMDMFYAAVEIRDNPELANLPVAVGSDRMVATSNYIARKFGVRSAMPGFIAKKLCPELKFVKANMEKYRIESAKVKNILKEYDKNFKSVSLDEAYLDITEYCHKLDIHLYNKAEEKLKESKLNNQTSLSKNNESIILDYTCNKNNDLKPNFKGSTDIKPLFVEKLESYVINKIKNNIYEETELTASIGIASNKMLAKICSDLNKPNGHFILENKENVEIEFMKDLKLRKIPSIGENSEIKYSIMGLNTCQDLIDRDLDIFYLSNKKNFEFIIKACLGIGSAYHENKDLNIQKSISVSKTFRLNNDLDFISCIYHELANSLYYDIEQSNLVGKTIHVEITDDSETHHSISNTLDNFIETEDDILSQSWNLMHKLLKKSKNGIRLLRLGLSKLSLFEGEKRKSLKNTSLDIKKYFKDKKLTKNDSTKISQKYIDEDYENNKLLLKKAKQNKKIIKNKNKNKNKKTISSKNKINILKKSEETLKNKNMFVNLINNMIVNSHKT